MAWLSRRTRAELGAATVALVCLPALIACVWAFSPARRPPYAETDLERVVAPTAAELRALPRDATHPRCASRGLELGPYNRLVRCGDLLATERRCDDDGYTNVWTALHVRREVVCVRFGDSPRRTESGTYWPASPDVTRVLSVRRSADGRFLEVSCASDDCADPSCHRVLRAFLRVRPSQWVPTARLALVPALLAAFAGIRHLRRARRHVEELLARPWRPGVRDATGAVHVGEHVDVRVLPQPVEPALVLPRHADLRDGPYRAAPAAELAEVRVGTLDELHARLDADCRHLARRLLAASLGAAVLLALATLIEQ